MFYTKPFSFFFLSFRGYISIQLVLSSNDNPYFSNFANLQVDDSGKHIPQLKRSFIFCTIDISDRKDPPRSCQTHISMYGSWNLYHQEFCEFLQIDYLVEYLAILILTK